MPEPTTQDQMTRMVTGDSMLQIVYDAAKLGIADRLVPIRGDLSVVEGDMVRS